MNDWHTLYITDCTGKKFFHTQSSPMSTASQIKNLKQHLEAAKLGKKDYWFIDSKSAVLMLDDSPYQTIDDILDDDLLAELMS